MLAYCGLFQYGLLVEMLYGSCGALELGWSAVLSVLISFPWCMFCMGLHAFGAAVGLVIVSLGQALGQAV